MPKNRVLTETDGPFAQIEGPAAMPWDANLAALGLAKLWSLSIEETNAQLHANLKALSLGIR